MRSMGDNRHLVATDFVQRDQYHALLRRICAFWQSLPDKPDETPEAVLRALWLAAAGGAGIGRSGICVSIAGDLCSAEPASGFLD